MCFTVACCNVQVEGYHILTELQLHLITTTFLSNADSVT